MKILSKVGKFFGPYEFGVYDGTSVWKRNPNERNIFNYLKAMNLQGKHIFIRPKDESCFLMCDDLNWDQVIRYHSEKGSVSGIVRYRPGRMVVESSPGNYQVWVHSENRLSADVKLHWLRKMGSDPGADPRLRWGRCPGFTNRKEKYRTGDSFPYASLLWCDWRRRAFVPGPWAGFFSIFPPRSYRDSDSQVCSKSSADRDFKYEGGGCVSLACTRADYECGDNNRTDFRYCLALLRFGCSESEIRNRLIVERPNWENHSGEYRMEDYFNRTVRRARMVLNGN